MITNINITKSRSAVLSISNFFQKWLHKVRKYNDILPPKFNSVYPAEGSSVKYF